MKKVLRRVQNLLQRLYKSRLRPCQHKRVSQNLESFEVAILNCFCKINIKCISFNHSKICLNSNTTGADSQGSQSNAAHIIFSRDMVSACTSCAGEPARLIHHTGTKFQCAFWFSLWDSSQACVVPSVGIGEEFIPSSEFT